MALYILSDPEKALFVALLRGDRLTPAQLDLAVRTKAKLCPATTRMSPRQLCAEELRKARTTEGWWSPPALLGLFYEKYKQLYGIDYQGNAREALRHAEILHREAGDMAMWCIEAFFEADLKWVTSKRLDFLSDRDKLDRFVLPAAAAVRKRVGGRAEWKPQAAAQQGVAINPLKRTGGDL